MSHCLSALSILFDSTDCYVRCLSFGQRPSRSFGFLMNAGAKIGKFLKRHWLTGYVTMLNGFVYDAYWAEKIERAFGLLGSAPA